MSSADGGSAVGLVGAELIGANGRIHVPDTNTVLFPAISRDAVAPPRRRWRDNRRVASFRAGLNASAIVADAWKWAAVSFDEALEEKIADGEVIPGLQWVTV